MARLRALSAALALAALTACGASSSGTGAKGCTEIGCVNGFTVDFTSPSWKAGVYEVTIDKDGTKVTCTTTLPFTSQNPDHACTAPDVMLGISGSALPSDQHALTGVIFTGTPKAVKLSLARDGKVLATGEYYPTYTTSRPNGPDCEPVCTQAKSDTLPVP